MKWQCWYPPGRQHGRFAEKYCRMVDRRTKLNVGSTETGHALIGITLCSLSSNSPRAHSQNVGVGCISKYSSCFSNRVGKDMSSLSIRAIHSYRHCFSPAFRALPNPPFCGSLTDTSSGNICLYLSITWYKPICQWSVFDQYEFGRFDRLIDKYALQGTIQQCCLFPDIHGHQHGKVFHTRELYKMESG